MRRILDTRVCNYLGDTASRIAAGPSERGRKRKSLKLYLIFLFPEIYRTRSVPIQYSYLSGVGVTSVLYHPHVYNLLMYVRAS